MNLKNYGICKNCGKEIAQVYANVFDPEWEGCWINTHDTTMIRYCNGKLDGHERIDEEYRS